MLKRQYRPVTLVAPAGSTCALPGLVSSARPIKRISAQLNDELALVHRFSYKNKNQHKASVWWNKIIHVDRTLKRTLDEVRSLLSQFGSSKESDEVSSIGSAQLVQALLQLPRSLILVEKSLQVLITCASILDQLVETKAFLAFVLVVVSLVARLHSLALVLHAELGNLGRVLAHLVETNKLSSLVKPLIDRLPTELRRHLPPSGLSSPRAPRHEPELASVSAGEPLRRLDDDLGSVIVRKPVQRERDQVGQDRGATTKRTMATERPVANVETLVEFAEDGSDTDLAVVGRRKKLKTAVREGEDGSLPCRPRANEEFQNPTGPETVAAQVSSRRKEKKKAVPIDEGEKATVIKRAKKKAKPRKSLDEIDAIFG